ncbi:MAG: 50S ribosomal protein L13e [Desulfurococcales archaeon]|nr:50S ribosomal protein L13e [Desulfurococcales archaeon]
MGEKAEPPVPIVKKPRLVKDGPIEPKMRRGRGFSIGELKEVGLTPKQARRLGLPVDKRRRSVHPWNVEALKEYLKKVGKG